MRALNSNELTAVSGGTFCHIKPVCAPKPVCVPKPPACNPLSLVLGFIGGALKLICTGEKSPSADCGCGTPPVDTPPIG